MRTKGVPETEVAEAMNLTQNDMRRHPERVSTELQGLNIEYQAVTAVSNSGTVRRSAKLWSVLYTVLYYQPRSKSRALLF